MTTANRSGAERSGAASKRVLRRIRGETDSLLSFLQGRMRSFPNDVTLRVFAQRRSGHHAIVNWIRFHQKGRHWFLNHCRPGVNPFGGADLSTSLVHGLWGPHRVFHVSREREGRHAYKGALIYNFEELDFSNGDNALSVEQEQAWVGGSARRGDILILRDPFNLLASKLKWAHGQKERPSKPSLEEVAMGKELWKVYAREYLGITRFLSDRIEISYNHWFSSRDYRDQLAARLGFDNRDLGLLEVAKWGPSTSGDSFDGLRYDGRAQDMRVLERWRAFAEDPFFLELCRDPELRRLSEEIFGILPGTEDLLS